MSAWRMKRDPYLSPCTKFKSKWTKDLNIKPGTVDLTEENLGNSLEYISIGNNFLKRILTVNSPRLTVNKWEF